MIFRDKTLIREMLHACKTPNIGQPASRNITSPQARQESPWSCLFLCIENLMRKFLAFPLFGKALFTGFGWYLASKKYTDSAFYGLGKQRSRTHSGLYMAYAKLIIY